MFKYDPQIRPVIVLALLTAACLVGDSMLYIVMPTHWREFGLDSLWEVGILLSANRLVRLPLNPLVGWVYKRISTRQGVLIAAVLALLTTLSYGFVKGFYPLLLIRCIWGVAWAFLRLGSFFAIADCAEDNNRGHCMGVFNGLYRLGSLAGMLAGGFIADLFGLAATALFFGAITLSAIPAAFRHVPDAKNHNNAKPEEPTPIGVLWRDSAIFWALTTGAVVAMIYQGIFTATLSYLVQTHNSSTVHLLGFAFGAASLAGILQAIRWAWEPWLAPWVGIKSDGRHGRRKVLLLSLLLATLLFCLLPLDIPLLPWLLVVMGVQVTATALTTLTDAVAADAAARASKVLVLTAYSLAIDLGSAIGPIIGYVLNSAIDPYAAYWVAALCLLLLSLAWLVPNKEPQVSA